MENDTAQYTLGQLLTAAREHSKLSQEDVASELRLGAPVIQAIEADQFTHAPATFMCGYVRSYARLVNIPQEHISAAIDQLGLVNKHYQTKPGPPSSTKATTMINKKLFHYLLVVIFLLALGIVWQLTFVSKQPQASKIQIKQTTILQTTTPQIETKNAVFAAALPEPGLGDN